jgi:hypothetical protein
MADNEASGVDSRSPVVSQTDRPLPVTEPPPHSARRSGRRWLVLGAIALVFLLVIGYVVAGAALAGGPMSNADRTLRTAVSHNNSAVNHLNKDPFRDINFTSESDIGAARTALAGFKQDLLRWDADVATDRTSLQRVRSELHSSVLTLPEQGFIDSRRHRVEAALSALATAQKGIDISKKQIAFMEPFLDAVEGFVAIGKAGEAEDIAGIQAHLPTTGARLQTAIELARPPAVPAELTPALQTMMQLLKDLQALVTAVKANDAAGVRRNAAALEADGKQLEAFDEKTVEKATKALGQPLVDAYNRDMKVAAGE